MTPSVHYGATVKVHDERHGTTRMLQNRVTLIEAPRSSSLVTLWWGSSDESSRSSVYPCTVSSTDDNVVNNNEAVPVPTRSDGHRSWERLCQEMFGYWEPLQMRRLHNTVLPALYSLSCWYCPDVTVCVQYKVKMEIVYKVEICRYAVTHAVIQCDKCD